MFERLISFSIYHRWLVLITTLAIGGVGLFNYQYLPIDAVPDITNVQVQINTEAIGYSPFEVEQQITFPIESVISGLPSLQYTRSLSKYGLSQVTVVFEDGTDIYFARQLINERLSEARDKLPKMITPKMGPIATGLGEIFMYTVGSDSDDRSHMSATELRTVQDWIIKPQLRTVPGVVEVNSIGGYQKKFVVSPKLDRLFAHGITFDDLTKAILENNLNRGAGYIEKTGEQFLVRAPGQVHSIEDIGLIPVANHSGVPVSLAEVADISLGSELRSGAATEDGKEVVLGTVFMLMGQNSRTVSQSVSRKMEEINRSLPKGVIAKTVYDRTTLVNATIATVRKNLFEGALLVIVILFFMLGNTRAALITACIIPLSMLITITGMVGAKISGNLMSLGALDFGLIVDGAVILVENCIRRFSEEQRHRGRSLTREERLVLVKDASLEVRQATMFGELIIMIVYLPILTLTGVEGKMFHPMAFTVLLALAAAMILSVTFVPAVVALFLTGDMSETEPTAIKWLKVTYERLLHIALKARRAVVVGALSILVFSLGLATRMGTEFIPSLDEGDIALHALRIPGTSLTEAVKMQHRLEERIKQFPEVKNVFAKIGTAEIANDPMPPNVADGFVILKPRAEWPNPRLAKAELVAEIQKAVTDVPGNNYEFTQPIQMRFNELIAGVRSDVAVKIFGDDLETLFSQANIVSRVLSNVSGAADVKVEQVTGLPMLSVVFDRQKLSRLGISLSTAQDVLATALGGETVGSVFEGDKRIEIVLRLSEENRNKLEIVKTLLIPVPPARESHGKYLLPISQEVSLADPSPPFVQLGEVATIELQTGPNQIGRENGKRRVVVTANVRGRALGSFVEDAQARVAQQVTLPAGYWISWGGQFEQLISAKKTLMIVVPLAIALILLLLYATLKNITDALLVFSGVPLALTGGIFALWLRGIPLSISAAVGFIALSGVAVLNGLVMISFIQGLIRDGMTVMNSTLQGSVSRLRPVLMTALVASLGFVPMALSQGTGAEVQRPLATVVIGGILSSTILTLFVLPALYIEFTKNK